MKQISYTAIGRKIKLRRNALHLTQEVIANQLNVNPSHISNIECGHTHPSLKILIQLADVLSCSVDCFIGDEYSISTTKMSHLDQKIIAALMFADDERKEKILKMIEILL